MMVSIKRNVFKIPITGLFLFILIGLTKYPVYTQVAKRDSLKNLIESQPPDTNKVNTMITLAFEMRYIDADSLLMYAKEAAQLSDDIQFIKGKTQAIRNIGLGHRYLGNLDSALYYCREAANLARINGFIQIEADSYNTMGNTYFRLSNYDSARIAFRKSLNLFQKIKDNVNVAISIASIAVSYSEQGKYSKAIEMYQEALLVFEDIGSPNMVANLYNNVANIYLERQEYDKALEYYLRTSKYDSITGNKSGRAHTELNLGNVLVHLGRNEEAKEKYRYAAFLASSSGSECTTTLPYTQLGDLYLEEGSYDSAYKYISKALNRGIKCENERDLASVYLDLGDYYRLTGDLAESKAALLKGYQVATKSDIKPKMEELANSLHEIFEKLNDYPNAYKYLKISKDLQNDLFNKESTEQIARLEAEYEFEKEKQQIQAEQERKELAFREELTRERLYKMGAVSLIVLIGLVAVFAIRSYRIKRIANEQLTEKNERLKELRVREQKLSEEALSARERELATMAMASLEKNNLLAELNQKVSFLEGRMSAELKPSLKEMRKTIADSISLDNSWDSFIHRFKDVHPQFFDRLKNENPNLTINDLKLSAYLKIGMSNKEIANVSHLTLGSVKSSINRLKKKLELGPDDSVRDYMLQYA